MKRASGPIESAVPPAIPCVGVGLECASPLCERHGATGNSPPGFVPDLGGDFVERCAHDGEPCPIAHGGGRRTGLVFWERLPLGPRLRISRSLGGRAAHATVIPLFELGNPR
jgi:hypothetical protein